MFAQVPAAAGEKEKNDKVRPPSFVQNASYQDASSRLEPENFAICTQLCLNYYHQRRKALEIQTCTEFHIDLMWGYQ